jgi:hypothetical protein
MKRRKFLRLLVRPPELHRLSPIPAQNGGKRRWLLLLAQSIRAVGEVTTFFTSRHLLLSPSTSGFVKMAVTVREPYQYLPITDHDGIRLIALQPSPDEAAVIECEIIHTTLGQARVDIYDNYTALSYVWGDANDLTTISTDGRPLRITTSLECALRHLRDTKRALNVWADGICINQQDETEKGRQVQQMGRVYETAAHTVIFLGEGNPAANSLLSIILSHSDDDSPIDDEDRIKALNYILQSPWFYRVCIFQELVLSKDAIVQYGHIRVPWYELVDSQIMSRANSKRRILNQGA